MKKLIAFLILTPFLVFAAKSRTVTFSGGSPLPTAYSASDSQSLVLSELSGSNKNLFLTASVADVMCSLGGVSSVTAPSTGKDVTMIANVPVLLKDIGHIKQIYCKSAGSALTSGWVSVVVY